MHVSTIFINGFLRLPKFSHLSVELETNILVNGLHLRLFITLQHPQFAEIIRNFLMAALDFFFKYSGKVSKIMTNNTKLPRYTACRSQRVMDYEISECFLLHCTFSLKSHKDAIITLLQYLLLVNNFYATFKSQALL